MRALRLSLVLIVAVAIQTTWLAESRPFGVPGDLLLLVAIAGGMAGGPDRGAVVGFWAGLTLDLVSSGPFGLTALAYLAVGYAVGFVTEGVLRSAIWIPLAATAAATVTGILFYVLLGQLVGQQLRGLGLTRIITVTTLMNVALCLPALWVARWVERAAPDRIPRLAR